MAAGDQDPAALLAAAFRHPIGISVLKQLQPRDGAFLLRDGAVESITDEILAEVRQGKRLRAPLQELVRVAEFFKEKQGTPVVEELLAGVINQLGAALGEMDTEQRQHLSDISKFLGSRKTIPAAVNAAPPEGSVKPWQRPKAK
ncbi:MAG: hypothetical protein AAB426_15330 [Myxococcota bacterium]